ncbi:hypothetical protein BDR22DRAFT_594665 [Usnea florida]
MDMNLCTTGNHDGNFPLLKLPRELRDSVYRHAFDYALPNLILPRWMQSTRWHDCTVGGHSVARTRLAATSFTNLQLSSRQVYREASYVLYQNCQFSLSIAPRHASFLDACLLLSIGTWDLQDKSYMHRITNVLIKANWDEYDWSDIRRFKWTNWNDITFVVCRGLLGFSNLRRLTLDWRVPSSCDIIQPTPDQWFVIFPHFEELRARRHDLYMEVLAWQMIPGLPFKQQEICRDFREFTRKMMQVTQAPRDVIVPFWDSRYSYCPWSPVLNVLLPSTSASSKDLQLQYQHLEPRDKRHSSFAMAPYCWYILESD